MPTALALKMAHVTGTTTGCQVWWSPAAAATAQPVADGEGGRKCARCQVIWNILKHHLPGFCGWCMIGYNGLGIFVFYGLDLLEPSKSISRRLTCPLLEPLWMSLQLILLTAPQEKTKENVLGGLKTRHREVASRKVVVAQLLYI